jgi:heme-degrading monooxygenase HmoA
MSEDGRVITVFRSRLTDGAHDAGYERRAEEMLARARAMPGFVEFKSYASDDGERVSVIQFASRATHDAWARDVEHRVAQAQGRDAFYAQYRITVAEVTSERAWPRDGVTPSG